MVSSPTFELVGERRRLVKAFGLEQRESVVAQTQLGEGGDLLRELGGQRQRLTGLGDPVGQADPVSLRRVHRAAGQDQVHRR